LQFIDVIFLRLILRLIIIRQSRKFETGNTSQFVTGSDRNGSKKLFAQIYT
jgi:hypothetical protein